MIKYHLGSLARDQSDVNELMNQSVFCLFYCTCVKTTSSLIFIMYTMKKVFHCAQCHVSIGWQYLFAKLLVIGGKNELNTCSVVVNLPNISRKPIYYFLQNSFIMLACRTITQHIYRASRRFGKAAVRPFSISSQSLQRPTSLHEFTEEELMLKDAGMHSECFLFLFK